MASCKKIKEKGMILMCKRDFLSSFTPYYDKRKVEEKQKKKLDFKPKYIMVERPTPTTELPYLMTRDLIKRKNIEK